MKLTRIRCFHDWRPGSAYTPIPLTHLDLQQEYAARLAEAVDANIPLLAAHLKTAPNQRAITRRLMTYNSEELKRVREARSNAAKREWVPSEEYATFLRHLYTPRLHDKKLGVALKQLPGSANSKQALYINSSHLETLISRSMDNPRLFRYVSELLENGELPRTARELATNVLSIAELKGNWRDALAHCWPQILETHDTGALNQLLKLAFTTHCKDTQSLVQYHLRSRENRFTYLLKLRYQHEVSPQDIVRDFQAHGFVIDTILISSYISGLLRLGRPRGVESAEAVFANLVNASRGKKLIVGNYNQLANCLTALDTVNQLSKDNIEVPLFADSRLFERMYSHFISGNRDSTALDTLESMALQGQILPRHIIISHMRHMEPGNDLERLFYLCCDFNMAHPGFISNTLADAWVQTIATKTETTFEEATSLVANCRAVAPPS